MTVYGTLLPGTAGIARNAALTESLTKRAKYKVKVVDWWRSHGKNVSLTARRFGIERRTFQRWLSRFKAYGILGLNEHSRKPKNVRKPAVSWSIVKRTVELRTQYPAWSKHKIRALLKREGIVVSVSTVGRILKRKGLMRYS